MKRMLAAMAVLGSVMMTCVPGVAVAQPRGRALHVASAITARPVSEPLRPAGRLTSPIGGALVNVKIADGTLIAESSGGVQVFNRPAAGWAHATAPAVFAPPTGESAGADGVGSGFVAFSDLTGFHAPTVLVRPVGGWSGSLSAAAQLAAAPESVIAAVRGDTVVTANIGGIAGPGYLQVFVEPPGGWSGTVAATAQLQTRDGEPLTVAAISGETIIAASPQAVYAFDEPIDGWSGVITPSARIPLSEASTLALSGRTLVAVADPATKPYSAAEVYMLRRPAKGWQAARKPAPLAYVVSPGDPITDPRVGGAAIAAGDVPVIAADEYGGEHECPCQTNLWAIGNATSSNPAASPKRPLPPSAILQNTEDSSIATDGSTIGFGSGDGVHLYTIIPVPQARRATLTGLTTSSPRLSLTITAHPNAPKISSIRISLPTGLSTRRTHLLTATSKKPRSSRTIATGSGNLIESPTLRARLSRIQANGGRWTLTLPIHIVDANNPTWQLTATFTITR